MTVYSVTEAMSWGLTPAWISGTLNKTSNDYCTSTNKTSKKNKWGTKTYHNTHYNFPSTIEPQGFDLDNWNSYSDSVKGSKAIDVYTNNAYDTTLNPGVWEVYTSTAASNFSASSDSEWGYASTSTGTGGSAKQIFQNNTAETATASITLSQGVSNTTSTTLTSGWSNSSTLAIGASISAEYEAIAATYSAELSTTLTESNTVSGSDTSSQSYSETLTLSSSFSFPVPPSSTYTFVLAWSNNKGGFGWTAPYKIISDDVNFKAKKSYSTTLGAGEAANAALNYGYNSNSLEYVSNNTALGYFSGISSQDYNTTATYQVFKKGEPVSTSSDRSSQRLKSRSLPLNHLSDSNDLIDVDINGHGLSVEISSSRHFGLGTNGHDRFIFNNTDKQLRSADISYYLGSGNDRVISGPSHDSILLDSVGSHKHISSGGGHDIIQINGNKSDNTDTTITIDPGKGKNSIHLDKLSKYSDLTLALEMNKGRDIVSLKKITSYDSDINIILHNFELGKDFLDFKGSDVHDVDFTSSPHGHLLGYVDDQKLFHFTDNIIDQASEKYHISDKIDKYEVALLNFGYLSLDTIPSTWNDLFLSFVGLSVTDSDSTIFNSWSELVDSKSVIDYLSSYAEQLLELGSSTIPSDTVQSIVSSVPSYIDSSSSIYDFIEQISNQASSSGHSLTLPDSYS